MNVHSVIDAAEENPQLKTNMIKNAAFMVKNF